MARNQTDFKVVQILVTFKMLRFCVPFACGPVGRCVLTVGSWQLMGREVVWLGMEVQPRREVIYMWNFNVMIPWTEKLPSYLASNQLNVKILQAFLSEMLIPPEEVCDV